MNTKNKQLKVGDKLSLVDIDGTEKEFVVLGVNRVTYTIAHQGHYPNGKPFNIPRSLRKDTFKVTR